MEIVEQCQSAGGRSLGRFRANTDGLLDRSANVR